MISSSDCEDNLETRYRQLSVDNSPKEINHKNATVLGRSNKSDKEILVSDISSSDETRSVASQKSQRKDKESQGDI